ncbi:agamous-like MADS-box protein AGL62 [Solanum stenotomum]|uniref:agamous-like MADS-box protein AGL62 n=1 Tax=Solanum stenotomum TaxID=172797 RepID=UPI0020D0122A|nr:agamous-like MADS-box protein AGL62 [Solanum stenotomum]
MNTSMENKKTKGRQKIPMRKIENKKALFTSFSKRLGGLFKTASELVKEFDVDIGIIVFFPTGKLHSFFHPTVDAVVSRFQNPDMQLSDDTHLAMVFAQNSMNQLKEKLEELDIKEKTEIARTNYFDQMTKFRQKGWWESIEQLNEDEVSKFEAWLNVASFTMHYRLNQLIVSSSLGCESCGV